uniref:Uncharacterized protein n=1 Tax=Hanusia phi TaxID=3032 RepID=A0A7S0EJB2_9CRYP
MANVTYNQPGPDQWDNAAMMKQGAPPGSAWDGTDQGTKVGDKSKGKMGRPKGAKDTKPRTRRSKQALAALRAAGEDKGGTARSVSSLLSGDGVPKKPGRPKGAKDAKPRTRRSKQEIAEQRNAAAAGLPVDSRGKVINAFDRGMGGPMRGRQGLPAMGMGGLVGPGMGYPGPPIPPGAFGDGRLSAASWAGHDPKMMQQWEAQGGNAQAFQRLSQGGGLDPAAWEGQGYPGGHMGPIPGHPGGYAAGWWHGQLHHYPMPGMPHMPGMMPGMAEGMVWPGMSAAPPPGAAEAGNMQNAGPEGMGPWQGMGGWVSNKQKRSSRGQPEMNSFANVPP